MRRPNFLWGALAGGLLTAPLVAVLYLGDVVAGLPFLPFDLFDWITRVMPGPLVTFGIDLMIDTLLLLNINVADTAKTAEQIMAIIMFVVLGAVTGAIFFSFLTWRKITPEPFAGLVMGALFGLPLVAISLTITQSNVSPFFQALWLGLLFVGWGLLLGWTYRYLTQPEAKAVAPASPGAQPASVERLDRRQFIVRFGAASAVITVVGAGVAAMLSRQEQAEAAETIAEAVEHAGDGPDDRVFPNAGDPVMPAPGTRPEYTPVKDHYKVFIRTQPTVIEAEGYVLPIAGLAANPLMLTLEDIHNNYESFDQYVTLSCISGRIGTSLISTTQWTGVSLQDILADVQPLPEARYLNIESGDGFHETIPLDLIAADRRIMLCHSWDGNTLPVDHGFPLRVWIPDRFGMKQPKWIVSMELMEEYEPGYWVERRWDEVARVRTTSVIDTVAVNATYESGGQQLIPVGGIAFSGDRGIGKVEVSVDEGPWTEAQLRQPLSETTWVIWRYDWPFEPGEHTFRVRCTEADGTPQIEREMQPRPSGATGIHSVEADIPEA